MIYEQWVLANCYKLDCLHCELERHCKELYLSERILNHEIAIFEKEILSGKSTQVFAEARATLLYGSARRNSSFSHKVVALQQK